MALYEPVMYRCVPNVSEEVDASNFRSKKSTFKTEAVDSP
jgi:hypothetical protein